MRVVRNLLGEEIRAIPGADHRSNIRVDPLEPEREQAFSAGSQHSWNAEVSE